MRANERTVAEGTSAADASEFPGSERSAEGFQPGPLPAVAEEADAEGGAREGRKADDARLAMAMRDRVKIHPKGLPATYSDEEREQALARAQRVMDRFWRRVADRGLDDVERDLFSFVVDGAGQDIAIEWYVEEREGLFAQMFHAPAYDGLAKRVTFGQVRKGLGSGRLNGAFSVLLHELQHARDDAAGLGPEAASRMNLISPFTGNLFEMDVLHSEFRANVASARGDHDAAWQATQRAYKLHCDRVLKVLPMLATASGKAVYEVVAAVMREGLWRGAKRGAAREQLVAFVEAELAKASG